MIGSDFDGTFSNDDEQFERDVAAVAKFRAAGNLFGLVSGRNIDALRWMAEHYKIGVDYLLADNGGTCVMGGETLFCEENKAEVLLPLCDFLMARGTKLIAVNRKDGTDMYYYKHKDGREEYDPRRAHWCARTFPQVSGYFSSAARCQEVAKELNEIFPHLDGLPNGACLDVVPRGKGKAAGLKALAARLGVEEGSIYAIGDNYNDLSMITAFNGYAVKNAPEDVQKQAPCGTVESVEELIGKLL